MDTNFYKTFVRNPAFAGWVQDLVFLGSRQMIDPETERPYIEENVETLVKDCIVQPYGDDTVSINPEGTRERVEKLVMVPPDSPIAQTDRVRDKSGRDHQIVKFKDWGTHYQLTLRQH